MRPPFPLYPCTACGQRRGYRLGLGGPWRCGGCRPVWALEEWLPSPADVGEETGPTGGIRPSVAFSDAAAVAEAHALDCRSAERFLRAVAAAR